jgi:hypothetical protein
MKKLKGIFYFLIFTLLNCLFCQIKKLNYKSLTQNITSLEGTYKFSTDQNIKKTISINLKFNKTNLNNISDDQILLLSIYLIKREKIPDLFDLLKTNRVII